MDGAFIKQRVGQAIERRAWLDERADAYRLIHGESDGLPGTFVDKYQNAIAVQSLCAGAEAIEPLVIEALDALLHPASIVLRNSSATRAAEKLERFVRVVKGGPEVVVAYREGDALLEIDLLRDQKTGSFLDQQWNHLRAGELAHGTGLDCFCYHGGFALQMAQACRHVIALDASELAIERVSQNAARNTLSNIEGLVGDAPKVLAAWKREGRRFDSIALDPPAFARGKKSVPSALSAYGKINRHALELLSPGGVLLSCSCSGLVSPKAFEQTVREAALSVGVSIAIEERRGAGPDHPVLPTMPETEYLKCLVIRRV